MVDSHISRDHRVTAVLRAAAGRSGPSCTLDDVTILATTFVYKGRPGLLLSDRRIIIRLQAAFAGPVELTMWLDQADADDSGEQ